jgi:Domain of unknown function (DUF222)
VAMARLGEQFAMREALATTTGETAGWVQRICEQARAANRAVAAELVAVGELFAYRWSQCCDTDDWAVDTEAAVAAEVGAALRISRHRAAGLVRYGRAMREQLPKTAAVFSAGDIDFEAFKTIVFRTDLLLDPQVLARVDEVVAVNVGRWPSLSRGRLGAQVDKIVARVDADAVRRRSKEHTDREVWIGGDQEGISRIEGTLFTTVAHALDASLKALVATVCPHDSRTHAQRYADAFLALAAKADRMACHCGRPDCAAATKPPASPVAIHVIAPQATLDGTGQSPASEMGADGLITPELLRELAKSASLVPLPHPGDAPPEPRYTPSQALADFVRARDLTCRWPGCEVPATRCDVDHTIPHAQGGPTHASNLKCYCRTHHLVKTFWGWHDQQLADGTLILTSPGGHTYVTTPGSALLFPSLCRAVGGIPAPEAPLPQDYCAERTAMMPKRRRTRAQDRANRRATERRQNHAARMAPITTHDGRPPPDDEPPPF